MNEWIKVSERLPEHDKPVLLLVEKDDPYWKKHLRKVIRGCHIEAGKEEGWDDYEDVTYSEEDDAYYVNEGWFEEIDFWEDYGYCNINDDWIVTNWMPLPELPQEGEMI